MDRLQGKVAIVTGAASGIGEAIALCFAREGARVIVSDVQDARGEAVAARCNEEGEALYLHCDVSREDEVRALVNAAVERFGRLDVLVNNAGFRASGVLHETTADLWDRMMAIDLKGVYLCSYYALPHLLRGGGGSIIMLSSVSGIAGDYGMAAYNAAKGAVTNLTRNMALDYAKDGVRVNAICPGAIFTPLIEQAWSEIGAEAAERAFNGVYPPGRIGRPEEVANVALFLASDESSFVSGANIPVDGGITAHTGQPKFEKPREASPDSGAAVSTD